MRRGSLAVMWLIVCAAGFVAAGCSKDPEVAKQEHFDRAEEYAAAGKHSEAIIEYRNAIQIDPQFGRARYRLAESYVKNGNVPAAFGEYVRAADLLDDPDVQMKAGNFLLLAGRYDEAKARAEAVLEKRPEDTSALVLRANALAGLKDLDGAVDEIQRAIAADPNVGTSYASLGAFQLLRGNRDEAEAAYAKAVESDPKSVNAHLALGAYRLAIGANDDAEQALRRAVELEPDNVLALRSLAGLYLSSRQFGKAEPIVRRLADESKDIAARLVLADVHVAMSQTDAARGELEALQDVKGAFVPARLRLAALEYGAGRTAEAHTHVDAVLAEHPKESQALVLKGRLLLLERKHDEAIAQFQKAVAADTNYDLGHFWLGTAYAMRRRADDAKKAFAEAARLSPTLVPAQIALSRLNLRDGDATSALSFAQQAVRSAPASIEARTAVVWALVGQKNIVRAQEELRAIAALRPNSPDLLVLQGTIDMMRKDPKAAERSFRKALEIRPESYEALAGMLQTQMVTGNVAAAREAAEAAVARAPSNAATLVLAARTYYQARQFDRAEQSLRKALDIDPQQLDAYALLGQIYIVQRRTDQAITEFDELSRRQSNPVSAHTIVGMLLQAANRRAEAKARYRTVLALDPSAAVAANNLAWLQVEDGENLDVALQLAQTSKSRLPDSPEVSHTLGYIYYLKGLYPSAIEALRLSIEKQPGVALYHHHLGMAYAKSGKVALARQSLDRALRLDGSFSGADEARATLASLK